jgi:hypothetical protein
MTVAIAHAAPTAPAPIIPTFMMGPRLRSEFSKAYRAKRPAQASIEISSMVTTHDQPMKIPAPKLMRSATANGLNNR